MDVFLLQKIILNNYKLNNYKLNNYKLNNIYNYLILTLYKQKNYHNKITINKMDYYYILPASIYWVGDVRHVMPDDIFNNVWKNNDYNEGVYNVNNYKFVVVPTVCGDDYYEDSEGFIYQVISGHLGLIDLALCNNATIAQMSKGKIYAFENPIDVSMKSGKIKIASNDFQLNIDTNEDEDENDEYLHEEYEYADNVEKDPDYVPEEEPSDEPSEESSEEYEYSNYEKKYEV